MVSPLGRFSEPAALITALGLVAAWIAVQLAAAFGVQNVSTSPALDTAAATAVGIILGQRAATNGAGKLARAAHARLDAVGAPPADTILS